MTRVLIDGATPDIDAFRGGWMFVRAAALASALAGCAIAALADLARVCEVNLIGALLGVLALTPLMTGGGCTRRPSAPAAALANSTR